MCLSYNLNDITLHTNTLSISDNKGFIMKATTNKRTESNPSNANGTTRRTLENASTVFKVLIVFAQWILNLFNLSVEKSANFNGSVYDDNAYNKFVRLCALTDYKDITSNEVNDSTEKIFSDVSREYGMRLLGTLSYDSLNDERMERVEKYIALIKTKLPEGIKYSDSALQKKAFEDMKDVFIKEITAEYKLSDEDKKAIDKAMKELKEDEQPKKA